MGPQSCATPVDAGHLGSGSWATGCVLTRTWALCRYRHKAHLLRDLKDIYDFEPAQQAWASAMADLLVQANGHAIRAREAGTDRLDPDVLAGLLERYRALAADGLQDNQRRPTRAPPAPPGTLPGPARRRPAGQPAAAYPRRPRRETGGAPVPRLRGPDPQIHYRPCRDGVHEQRGGKISKARQSPAAQFRRRLLAHPGGPGRVRDRAVLPVHRRQVEHRRARRLAPAVHHRALAPARPNARRCHQDRVTTADRPSARHGTAPTPADAMKERSLPLPGGCWKLQAFVSTKLGRPRWRQGMTAGRSSEWTCTAGAACWCG